jgi:hypothetical protein
MSSARNLRPQKVRVRYAVSRNIISNVMQRKHVVREDLPLFDAALRLKRWRERVES